MNRSRSALQVMDYRARRIGLSAARVVGWWVSPSRWPSPKRHDALRDGAFEHLIEEVRAPLARKDAHADAALEAGKRTNLALAAPYFDGLLVSSTRPLSFWRALGRTHRSRGFTWGMELRGGCVVPSIAGGLCLLSNALFELAARAGWRIEERHGHSLEAIAAEPGTLALDATVAWPDVDLVFATDQAPARLDVRIVGDELIVSAFAATPRRDRVEFEKDERVEVRGQERWRTQRITRRRFDPDGAITASEIVAEGARRVLDAEELGRTCINCGETACRDRPEEPVLIELRRVGARQRR